MVNEHSLLNSIPVVAAMPERLVYLSKSVITSTITCPVFSGFVHRANLRYQTPIEEHQLSIESMLTLPEGVSVSWLDKHISRLGNFTNTRTLKVAKKSAIYISGSPFTSFSAAR